MTEEQAGPDNSKRQRFAIDIAIMLAVVPVILATVKAWIFSQGQLATLLVLARDLDVPATVIGAMVQSIPSVAFTALVIVVVDPYLSRRAKEWSVARFWTVPVYALIGLFVVLSMTVADLGPMIVAVGYSVIAVVRRIRKTRQSSGAGESVVPANRHTLRSFALALVPMVIATSFGTQSWLPTEIVRVSDEVTVGFVVEATGEWFTVIEDGNGMVKIFPSSEVSSRELCYAPQRASFRETLTQHLNPDPPPACDDATET